MSIGQVLLKSGKFAVKNLVRGSENITAARKAVWAGEHIDLAGKKGLDKAIAYTQNAARNTIFYKPIAKAKAGWKALVSEYKAFGTATTKAAATTTTKAASKFGIKSVFNSLKKVPLVGTIMLTAMEIPSIYEAFKNGGIWEGTKEIAKSATRLLVGAGACALGTAVGGPLVGMIAWGAADSLLAGAGDLVGLQMRSYSQTHPETREAWNPEVLIEKAMVSAFGGDTSEVQCRGNETAYNHDEDQDSNSQSGTQSQTAQGQTSQTSSQNSGNAPVSAPFGSLTSGIGLSSPNMFGGMNFGSMMFNPMMFNPMMFNPYMSMNSFGMNYTFNPFGFGMYNNSYSNPESIGKFRYVGGIA